MNELLDNNLHESDDEDKGANRKKIKKSESFGNRKTKKNKKNKKK